MLVIEIRPEHDSSLRRLAGRINGPQIHFFHLNQSRGTSAVMSAKANAKG
jgi:hypothetical protein